ncbi:MAG: HAMP domain-containing protein [Nitrospirae bacterium]|nr:HAMP domain-containing protein [Nitrospirota bacterium]
MAPHTPLLSYLATGFSSLRTKFVLFVGLIIIIVCSGLSWYFTSQQSTAMTRGLTDRGTLLARNLAAGSRYPLIAEDQIALSRLAQSVMELDEVVYVVMTTAEGRPLLARSKGRLLAAAAGRRAAESPLYPDPAIARRLLTSATPDSVVTPFTAPPGETLYDFAFPVQRRSGSKALSEPFGLESQEQSSGGIATRGTEKTYGVVQVGLTAAPLQSALSTLVRDVALITIFIILLGLLATLVLANRIVMPLRHLAAVVGRITAGDLTASVIPTTRDEVGALAGSFNKMTASLIDRDRALTAHMETILSQVAQLTTLNRTGMAMTSTLDVEKLLSSVLSLLVGDQAFQRMLILLYDADRGVVYAMRSSGLPEEHQRILAHMEMAVQDDTGVLAQVLLHGQSVHAQTLEAIADRLPPGAAGEARALGVTSLVVTPLKTTQSVMGLIAADRGPQPCTSTDLDLLATISSQMAIAIDNAHAYRELELLTRTLEERVKDRTQELEQANERLREMDHLKSAFVSVVSHELRTPMTSIKGYVENMLQGLTGGLTEKQTHYLNRMKLNVERLTRLINDLLDLSRIEMGRLDLRRTSLCVRDLSAEVVEGCLPLAQEKGIALDVQYPATLSPVSADRDKLTQVLTNLIQNAIKFTPERGQVRVEIRSRDDGFIQVNVKDTGSGIPSDELDKVFQRFYRSAAAPPGAQGAGLGLTITKNLVELHGGRIWVSSRVGIGSCFSFTLPIETSAGPKAEV